MQFKMVVTMQAYIYSKFRLFELVKLIWLREVSLNGMVKLGMKVNWEFWEKHI